MTDNKISFGITSKGKPSVLYKQHEFVKHREYANGNVQWRCKRYQNRKCQARLTTKNDEIVGECNPQHNHEADKEKILARQAVAKMKDRIIEVSDSPADVIGSVCETLQPSTVMALPKKNSLKRTLQRKREKLYTKWISSPLLSSQTTRTFGDPKDFQKLFSNDLKYVKDRMTLVEGRTLLDGLTRSDLHSANFTTKVPGRRAVRPSAGLSRPSPNTQPSSISNIDFSQVRVPVPGSSVRASSSTHNNFFNQGLSDHIAFRQAMLDNPQHLENVKKIYPPVVESMLSGNEELYIREFFKFGEYLKRQQPLLMADPMNVEVQKKIAEEIQRKNIEENMTMAMEENPESFAQVVMLWINLKVNGHHVKAFVDSGAQMTIMSAQCAERCNIMRLVDSRWEGVAKGVGTQKIIGRIHLAQIQIEDVFLQCSFCVLEDQPMDVLLGLDMLRRHLCVINLRENYLMIGTNNTKTHFLSESELPSYGRLHDPNEPPGAPKNSSKDGNVSFCQRQEFVQLTKIDSSVQSENNTEVQPQQGNSSIATKRRKKNENEPPQKVKKLQQSPSTSSS